MQSSVPLPSSAQKAAGQPRVAVRRRGIRKRWLALLFVLGLLAIVVWLVARELRTSELQARELSRIAHEASFQVEDGPSPSIRFPTGGPYDERLGYTQIPDFVARLSAAGQDATATAQRNLTNSARAASRPRIAPSSVNRPCAIRP
jgi:hypothetical protein